MRYLPLTEADRRKMLETIGAPSVDSLYRDVPESVWCAPGAFDLPDGAPEMTVERHMAALAARNSHGGAAPFFIGGGLYRHHVPATVDHLIQRSEFLTAYTPYQPEISQGTLQTLFEFQTQVALLTGMEVANASLYDGSTGAAEAVLMAGRVTKRRRAVLSGALHPHYRAVVRTQLSYADFEIVEAPTNAAGDEDLSALIDDKTACVVVQNPGFFGHVRDLSPLADAAHGKGALLVAVVTEVVSLGAIKSPGAMGADIVVGEGQSLGNPVNFGGPTVGLFATRKKFLRQMPGRLCGETVDADGKRGYVLTLSTREQHIRREKATSNICTSAGLCATAFTIHLSLLGEEGFTKLARINHARAVKLADALAAVGGVEVVTDRFFNEFTVKLSKPAAGVVDALAERGVLAGVAPASLDGFEAGAALDDLLLVAATELTTDDDITALVGGLKEVL